MDQEALQVLSRVLLYGGPESRRASAAELLRRDDMEGWRMLVGTVRSREPWLLRARALEVLGLLAAEADQPLAEAVLDGLVTGSFTSTDHASPESLKQFPN